VLSKSDEMASLSSARHRNEKNKENYVFAYAWTVVQQQSVIKGTYTLEVASGRTTAYEYNITKHDNVQCGRLRPVQNESVQSAVLLVTVDAVRN